MNSRVLSRCLCSAFFLFLCSVPLGVSADTIPEFAVKASVSKDRLATFTEDITYDFGDVMKHGIYRYIPVVYPRDNGSYQLRLKIGAVTRDGVDEPYSKSMTGGDLMLKIGDANRTIDGPHSYGITYSTDRAINFLKDHDELYWNVTGNSWPAPIEHATFVLSLPAGIDPASVTSTCFTGVTGSTEHGCTISQVGSDLTFESTRVLQQGEELTIVVGLPKGIITPPSATDLLWQFMADNGVAFFPVMAFLVMFLLWWKRGRDPKLGTVIPEYEPPQKLSPALTGAIMTNGDVPSRTLTATIIDLARRGYLKISFDEKKTVLGLGHAQTYTFIKQKAADDKMTDYETTLFDGLFSEGDSVKIDDLQGQKFYVQVASYKKQVQKVVDTMKVFTANPAMVRGAYISVAFFLGWGMFAVFGDTGVGVFAAIMTAIIIAAFGIVMPSRTLSGVRLYADLKGFKWFLSVTEKDRLDFHNAPERTPEQFMAFLPYAIAFEVETKWAGQFASLDMPPPSWATGTSMAQWNTMMLVSNLGSLHAAAASSGFSPPSSAGSGGSGFSGGGSGGGFGGGGGGSW